MAKLIVGDGLGKYIEQLEKLDAKADGVIKRAVYKGTRVVLDAIDSRIDSIPSNVANDTQRQALHEGLGTAGMKNTMVLSWDHKVGFDGYYDDGKEYKRTKYTKESGARSTQFGSRAGTVNNWNAIPFLANRIESGVSNHTGKCQFVHMAVNTSRSQAEKAMQDSIEKDIQNLTK